MSAHNHERPADALVTLLEPIAARIAELSPAQCTDPDAAAAMSATLEAEFPFAGAQVQAIARLIDEGIAAGWLCDRGEPSARFCRLAKPGPRTAEMSVDIVALQGAALAHDHPNGEVTLAFAAAPGTAGRFDGHPPGWVVMPAGSSHTPTVTGARMHLLYFLPHGAVRWHAA